MKKLCVIPYPKSVTINDGELDCNKFCIEEDERFAIKDFISYACAAGAVKDSEGVNIKWRIDSGAEMDDEGYILDISSQGIDILAGAEGGLRYAFCTLRQLFHNYKCVLPCCHIEDEPYLKYRSMLLDSGRYYFVKSDVMKFIDFCYLHKLNVFHWHLTEDQGWRIQIDKYPLLTEKGSRRSHTNFGIIPHGGYYTKQEIREVIAYANERGIEVVPEIDMPGHMQAALACYPYLGCFDRKLKVATHWGVKHDVLCAGKESSYQFVFDVLEEVIELFGNNTKYIHIGADEVFKQRWSLCEHCQSLMEREGLNNLDELQAYFMKRVSDWLTDRGFIPIVWNGVETEKLISDKLIWQFWSDVQGGSDSLVRNQARQSGGYINSNSRYTYIDFPYGMISLKDSYAFKPLPDDFPEDKLVGATLTLWTEYVPDFKTGCKLLLPRTCALSEAMWRREKDDYSQFEQRLAPMLAYLKKEGFISAPKRSVNPGKLRAAAQNAWFGKRVLHWQGLHNLIDDACVKRKYSKKKK